ncbi:hypothetical protein [Psychrobacter lutiphocae]|uniref:hypothetical protein n=1 Tax=Psychrobacter lutiphocae TaxID=540500 RepID=UPI0003785C91|nr:hypothetical protein [Psychrobacter lutiphocae]
MNTKSIVASLALGSLVTLGGCTSTNPFSANAMDSGYKNGEKAHQGSCGANKKAEAKCGAEKSAEAKCGADKKADSSCGADKKMDAKCGEAKCGGTK